MNHLCRDKNTMTRHLMLKGYMPNYTVWVCHGEHKYRREEVIQHQIVVNEDDGIGYMLDDMTNKRDDLSTFTIF